MLYTTEWLVKAVVGRIEAYAEDHGVPAAGRIYWETLRTIRPLVEEVRLQVRVDKWLRAFNFSDASYKAGPKLENDDLLGLEMGVLYYDPDLGEWLMEDDPDEVDDPAPLLNGLDVAMVRDHGHGPYATDALNKEFWEAQGGGYPMVGSTSDRYDDHDTREPDGWAEYFQVEGLFDWISSSFTERFYSIPDADDLYKLAIKAHRAGELTVVDLAVLATVLNIEDLSVQVYSLVDGTPIGSLGSFIDLWEHELADIELDLPQDGWSPRFAWEEQAVADFAAREFEAAMLAFWKENPGTYTDFRTKQQKPRKWSDAWYDLAYIRAIASGYSTEDAKWAGQRAKARAEGRTISRTIAGVTWKGLKMTNGHFLRWQAVTPRQVKTLKARDSEKVLAQLREGWKRLVAHRPAIETLGRALA
jgi:hypothetical protein